MTAIIGMSAFTIANGQGVTLESADYAFSFMATHVLGPVFGLVLMIAGLSATMSSGDSDAISGITILLTDVYPSVTGKTIKEEDYPKYSRIALVVTLGVAFLITLFVNDVITYIQKVVGSLLPGLAICMFMGRFWKRATWQGGMACIISGTGFGLLYLLVPSLSGWVDSALGGAAVPATVISLICGVVVSLVTPADTTPDEERVKAVFDARAGK